MTIRNIFSLVTIAVCFVALFCWVGSAWGDGTHPDMQEEVKKVEKVAQCPATKMTEQDHCFKCHTKPNFLVKEASIGEGKTLGQWLSSENGKLFINYDLIGSVDGYLLADIRKIRNYLVEHPGFVDRVVINGISGGGGMFVAWDVIGLMQDLKARGIVVETRTRGFGASAAFLIFASGSKGHRVASPTAEFMWHEVRSWAMFDEKNPSKLEDEARIFRHFQDNANKYLVSVSNVTKAFLDKHIDKDELWLTGKEMLKHGFADRLIE